MFDWLSDPNAWLALITLVILEIILGIDNIIFLSLIVAKLPRHQQGFARKLGLSGAMLMRIALLYSLVWITHLSHPLFYIYRYKVTTLDPSELINLGDISPLALAVSARDIILFFGGLFLIWKGILEINELFTQSNTKNIATTKMTLLKGITQIMILDIVFSLDSVISAIGLSDHLLIMIAAVVIAVLLMMVAAKSIGQFVNTYPTVKMLAIAFLVLIGGVLVIDSLHYDIPKGYIYFALFFALAVESLNLLRNKRLAKHR